MHAVGHPTVETPQKPLAGLPGPFAGTVALRTRGRGKAKAPGTAAPTLRRPGAMRPHGTGGGTAGAIVTAARRRCYNSVHGGTQIDVGRFRTRREGARAVGRGPRRSVPGGAKRKTIKERKSIELVQIE